jgi:transcription antitermination factor NusG
MAVACPETGSNPGFAQQHQTPVLRPDPVLHWFALKVRSRAEKTVGDTLSCRGLEVFCPTYLESRKYSDRLKTLHSPLFPGYLFCKLAWANRLPALSAPNVEYIVGFGTQPTPVNPAEVEAIQAIVRSGSLCKPHPFLRVGQRVRMRAGPLADLEGILVGSRGHHRLIVSVDLLQRSVATEVDSAHVRPV